MGETSQEVTVRARELTRRFGDFTAVDRVSFEVRAGEIFGFLGPNGAGKTTVIRMLCGLLPPSEGAAWVGGIEIRSDRAAIQRQIGYMSQKFSLYTDLTVSENIELFAGLYGVTGARFRERRAWLLDMAGLKDAQDRVTESLPLGWKQRLALGCAVLHEPPILFLDEPTSGVDPVARRAFWDLIDELTEGGTTVFVSTHYMEEAEYCHRLALMNRGVLIATDTPSGFVSSMGGSLLEVRTEDAPGAVAALDGAPGVTEAAMFGRAVHVTVSDREEAEAGIPASLAAAGIGYTSLAQIPPSLEHVFVSLVQGEGGAREG